MARRDPLFSLLLLIAACGGDSSRTPVGRAPVSPAGPFVESSGDPSPSPRSAPPPDGLDQLAPEPAIRVGLLTRATAVRLSSSSPFLIGTDESWISTADVLVELETGTLPGGATYRVQLGSFLEEHDALRFRDRIREETETAPTVRREPGTGRYAVRVGALDSESGAQAIKRELEHVGLEGLRIVREPASQPLPTGLLLTPFGGRRLRTSELALLAVPGDRGAPVEVDGSPYRGYLQIAVNGANFLTVVNVVHLEDYLRGVVPAELSPGVYPEKEALKAQAIAARTYAVKRAGEFAAEGYDICATPACQVYRGMAVEDRLSDEAVLETRREVLTFEGELVDALYTSTCGGRTENAENVFSSPAPYLVSRVCFRERSSVEAFSANGGPLPLSGALLSRLGVLDALPPAEAPVSVDLARSWLEATLAQLGQTGCFGPERREVADEPLDLAGLASLLGEALCWDRRLPFLLSNLDADRVVGSEGLPESARRNLAFALREGLVRPAPDGLRPGGPAVRDDVLEALFRIVMDRAPSPLRDGWLVEISPGRLRIRDESLGDRENEIVTRFSSTRYLYKNVSDRTYYAPRLTLLPADRVRFRMDDEGIDLLVLDAEGGTFDRSSRFSHWTVVKSNEELSREVGLRHPVGRVLELRPKRYGISGRLAELEVVGTEGKVTLTGLAIRRALGIRENLFFLDAQNGPDGGVRGWVFTGRGWGHGVGLCQVGAYGMAAAGYSYREILSHYYTGTRLESRGPELLRSGPLAR